MITSIAYVRGSEKVVYIDVVAEKNHLSKTLTMSLKNFLIKVHFVQNT